MTWATVGLAAASAAIAVRLGWVAQALARERAASWRAERLLALLADGAAGHALVELDERGRIVRWNAAAQRLYGYAAAEIIGRHCSCLYTEEERSANVPQKQLELAARQGRLAVSGERTGKDARRFATDTLIEALRDGAGRLVGFGCIEHDVSDAARMQRSLEGARAQLSQAQKLAALGQLADGIAHDFNNIIQVIGACVQTLQRRLAGRGEADEFLQMIARNAERAGALSQQLLSLARRAPCGAVLTNVNEVVAEVVALLRHTLREQITLDVRIDGALLWTVIDPNQLEAALLSLAVNARDAMAAGGTLWIETAQAAVPPPASDGIASDGCASDGSGRAEHYILIVIAHSGSGTGREVFGPAAVRGFIEQSGGVLTSEPHEKNGTAVRIYLPRRAG